MKIELELTRSEAHELNYLIHKAVAVSRADNLKGIGRIAGRAVNAWNDAYMEGVKRD